MELPVLIEPLSDRPGYSAELGAPFHLRAEGATADEAREQLTRMLRGRLRPGVRLEAVRVPVGAVAPESGWLPDDDLTREWREEIERYRRECDEADRRRISPAGLSERT